MHAEFNKKYIIQQLKSRLMKLQVKQKKTYQKGNKDEEFVPDFQAAKIPFYYDKSEKRKQKRRKFVMISRCQKVKEGLWSPQQNEIYLNFLVENKQCFTDETTRRSKKIFIRLSHFLPNRTSEQCRSHHQKLQKQIDSEDPEQIISYLKQRMSIRFNRLTQLQKISKIEEQGYQCIEKERKHHLLIKIKLNQEMLSIW